MKIFYDENMPYAPEFFSEFGECTPFSGRDVTADQLKDADVLLVRSITKVNEALLSANDSLKFVGTATIGVEHVDQEYLAGRDVTFSSAPGCNAKSVADYVVSSLFVLAERHLWQLQEKTIAIIGAGNIGTRLATMLDALGLSYVLCDPILAQTDDPRTFVSYEEALQADIITFHVPMVKTGEHQTHHLVDENVIAKLRDGQTLINSCRGGVFDNAALLSGMQNGKKLHLVMDVWENEPDVNTDLMARCEIATSHIAGYSLEGKGRGTEILYQQLCKLVGRESTTLLDQFLPEYVISNITIEGELGLAQMKPLVHAVYDVRRDDALLRTKFGPTGAFDQLRKQYPQRRELSAVKIITGNEQQKQAIYGLGFQI